MNETCQKAEDFLNEIVDDIRFDLDISAEWIEEEGCVIEISGDDTHFLLSENGEMLDAFETLLFQLYGRDLDRQHRFICDADGFRLRRFPRHANVCL